MSSMRNMGKCPYPSHTYYCVLYTTGTGRVSGFLNSDNGTWAMAPYLDKHGEADPTLRRSHQLFLNQKRYDILLRKVWLESGVPSLIARRMEGEMNNGGWETM